MEASLRTVHRLGGANSLLITNSRGATIAHTAAEHASMQSANILRVICELGAKDTLSACVAETGLTPAHIAATEGDVSFLEALHELGASASFTAIDSTGQTPVHCAVSSGSGDCVRLLHRCGAQAAFEMKTGGIDLISLAWEHIHNFQDPDDPYFDDDVLLALFECLGPRVRLEHKQEWLHYSLEKKVKLASDEEAAASLDLVGFRENILHGLCTQLGVESNGQVAEQEVQHVSVRFQGENSEGDGLKREWFEIATNELLQPDFGLFCSRDGGRTLQPNPHAAVAAGALSLQ